MLSTQQHNRIVMNEDEIKVKKEADVKKVELDEDNLYDFEIYEPLISGIRLTSGIRAWLTVAMLYRRIIMVLVAITLWS